MKFNKACLRKVRKTEFHTKKWAITLSKMGNLKQKSNLTCNYSILKKFNEEWLSKMRKTEFPTKKWALTLAKKVQPE